MTDVAKRGVTAVKWSAASTVGRVALQFLAQAFLARALGPSVYGLFGMAFVVFTFSNFLATFGFGWALLQLVDVRPEDVRFAFTWQLAAGLVVALALYLGAPLLGDFYNDVRVVPVIRWLSLACVFNAAASPAYNLLQRDLNFRATGIIDVTSYAVGYLLVGIPLAAMHAGVYALVAAWLVQSLVKLVAGYASRVHPVRPLLWYDGAPAMFSVGGTVFVTNLVNWFLNNLDGLLVGRLLNATAVGLYNVGYNLAITPNSLFIGALQPAFFSASAHMQQDLTRLRRAYLHVLASVWVLIAPMFVFASLVAGDVVRILYGPAWRDAGGVLSMLFLAMPLYLTWALSTPVLWNTGRKHFEAALQLPMLGLAVLAYYHFAPLGIYAVAWVTVALLACRGLVIGAAAFRALAMGFGTLAPHLARASALSAVTAAGVRVGQLLGARLDMPIVSLFAAGVIALAMTAGVVGLFPAILGAEAAEVVLRFLPGLRARLGASALATVPPARADA